MAKFRYIAAKLYTQLNTVLPIRFVYKQNHVYQQKSVYHNESESNPDVCHWARD